MAVISANAWPAKDWPLITVKTPTGAQTRATTAPTTGRPGPACSRRSLMGTQRAGRPWLQEKQFLGTAAARRRPCFTDPAKDRLFSQSSVTTSQPCSRCSSPTDTSTRP